MLAPGVGLTTFARIISVCGVKIVTVPTTQVPLAGSYVPWLGAAETNDRPAGSRSAVRTFVAVSGPLFVSVMV